MKKRIKLEKRIIGNEYPCFIVAEAGINHNGSVHLAQKLIKAAAASGADAIKFQSFAADTLIHPSMPEYSLFKALELTLEQEKMLHDVAQSEGIIFFSTPYDTERVDFLSSLNVPIFKIASGDLTHIQLIRHVASKHKPIVISTGMADNDEIAFTLSQVRKMGGDAVILLYCISLYPPSFCDIKLVNMIKMRDNFNVPVGFSDHSPELSLSIAAATMGACVIERHFTLDRNMSGPDHAISDNPEMLSQFIRGVRHIECCLEGLHTTQKVALYSQNEALPDKKMRIFSRRGAYARCNINAGEPIKISALKFLRPQKDGVSPSTFYRYQKAVAKRPIKEGALIKTKMLDIE